MGIMEDDGPGSKALTSYADSQDKFEKRWIKGTPLGEVSNMFRRLNQNPKKTIWEHAERILRKDGRLMCLGMVIMRVDDADRAG